MELLLFGAAWPAFRLKLRKNPFGLLSKVGRPSSRLLPSAPHAWTNPSLLRRSVVWRTRLEVEALVAWSA
jgi:hypothetical protein